MHVVYILGTGSLHDDIELRFSLRSLKFVKGLNKVFIVGHRPNWVTEITHLPFEDKHKAKDRNLIDKIKHYCEQSDGNPFIKMSDDHVFIKEWSIENHVVLNSGNYRHWCKQAQTLWVKKLLYTMRLYIQAGVDQNEVMGYDTHSATLIKPGLFLEAMDRVSTEELDNITWGTWYGNYAPPLSSISSKGILKYFNQPMNSFPVDPETRFISYAETAVNQELINWIKTIVGGPSKFELF